MEIILTALIFLALIGVIQLFFYYKNKRRKDKNKQNLLMENVKQKNEIKPDINVFVDAAKNGDIAILRDMISKGLDVNAKNESRWSALIMASYNGHKDAVELLLDSGADPNLPSWTGETALIRAAMSDHVDIDIVKLLINRGANVNSRDNVGTTAVMRAALAGQRSVVEFLLDKRADVNAKDNSGHTAWTFAAQRGHTDVLKELEKYGKKYGIKINMPPPPPSDPWIEVGSLLTILHYDYGVIVYRNENDEIKTMIVPEKKSENPLNNPKVKQHLEELYSFPQGILYSSLPKGLSSTEIKITEVFDKTDPKTTFQDNSKLIDFKQFNTKKATEAVEVLMTKAIFAAPSISQAEVIDEYKKLRLSWLSKELVKGSLSQVKKIILSNLEELAALNRFNEFIIEAYPDQKCAQVNAMFTNPQTFLGIRLWRTQDAIFTCGDKDFRIDISGISGKQGVKTTQVAKKETATVSTSVSQPESSPKPKSRPPTANAPQFIKNLLAVIDKGDVAAAMKILDAHKNESFSNYYLNRLFCSKCQKYIDWKNLLTQFSITPVVVAFLSFQKETDFRLPI